MPESTALRLLDCARELKALLFTGPAFKVYTWNRDVRVLGAWVSTLPVCAENMQQRPSVASKSTTFALWPALCCNISPEEIAGQHSLSCSQGLGVGILVPVCFGVSSLNANLSNMCK